MTTPVEFLSVAVQMRRRATIGPVARWQPWRWELAEVLPHQQGFGQAPRLLYGDEHEQRWLHPGHRVELFKDDAEGYELNLSSPAPCWFVMWRLAEPPGPADASSSSPIALPQAVSLSYHDAGRWLDAQESVEQVPAPAPVVAWLRAFAAAHHAVEPKRRQRPQSFRTLQDRFGNPVSISTGKHGGGARNPRDG